jgi:DNA relaxase NicK
MNQNKLSFESERLVMDYLSFNITGCKDPGRIANYLSDSFGFNSVAKETFQGKSEDLIFKITNEYKVSFIKSTYNPESNSHWTGLIVRFSGENGEYFYSLVQKKLIDWSIFDLSCTNIGRLDLYYFRKSKSTDQNDLLELFMENSYEKVNAKSKRKKASWKRTSRGMIMRIGNRSNSNYYRVYEKTKKINHDVYDEIGRGVEFELELKNQLIKSFQKLLFKNHIEEFESRLVEHFYKYSKKSFVLDTCYTDWLQIGLRKIVSTKKKSETNFNFLVSSYLRKDCLDSFVQKKQLSFIRSLEYSKQFIDDQVYYLMEFAVMDFISFRGGKAKSTYQRTKALEFLTSLQDIKPLIQKFSNNEFRRSVMFPYLKLTKQNRQWTIIMTIGEEFYFYQYPFFFPNSFLIYKNKYDLEIKLELIESFSQVELEKKLMVKEFLNQFCVSNKDLTKIKKQLIDSVSELKDSGLIENEFSLTFKNGSLNETKKIEDLSPGLLSKSESLSFWEKM